MRAGWAYSCAADVGSVSVTSAATATTAVVGSVAAALWVTDREQVAATSRKGLARGWKHDCYARSEATAAAYDPVSMKVVAAVILAAVILAASVWLTAGYIVRYVKTTIYYRLCLLRIGSRRTGAGGSRAAKNPPKCPLPG